jgi:hypothetical protein
VALVRIDISEECSASIIRVKIFDEVGITDLFPSVLRFLVTANVVLSSPILVILMMEVIKSSGTLVLKRATRRHIPEDGILHSHRREYFKSSIALTGWGYVA